MSDVTPIPVAFVHEYERHRAAVLRRRALWYCAVALAILGVSVGVGINDTLDPTTTETPRDLTIGFVADGMHIALHVGAIVLLLHGPVRRDRVVRIICWLIGLVGAVSIVSTPLMDNSSLISGATPEATDQAIYAQGLASLTAVLLLHVIASVLINLSPREGLRPLVPLLVLFALWVLIQPGASLPTRLTLIVLSPLAGLPGLLFSWWRHRSFVERFQSRAIARRYEHVTRDLSEARRVHEAIFPEPITSGQVNLDYRYQPAHHIGGDFLFVRTFTGPTDPETSTILVVILDVTGHGVPAALAVNRIHGELERLVQGAVSPDAGKVISGLNHFAVSSLASQRLFATALCLTVESSGVGQAIIRWASTGHPDALLARTGGAIEPLPSTTCMLGVLEGELFDAAPRETRFCPEDRLIAVTDGVIEATDAAGHQLGRDGLVRMIAGLNKEGSFCGQLVRHLERRRDAEPEDDILVVELRLRSESASH